MIGEFYDRDIGRAAEGAERKLLERERERDRTGRDSTDKRIRVGDDCTLPKTFCLKARDGCAASERGET